MIIGYVRVSSLDQNTIRQEVIMKDLGAEEIFIDKLSGKDTNRSELQKMIAFARKGDTIIVESISRFARNTKDLLTLIDLLTEKGVEFVSKKENIDTTTPTGKFMLTVFGAVAELEREYILQRQKEGIAIAKSQGKYTGRKRIENANFDTVYDKWQAKEVTAVEAMKILNMKKSTFYRRVSEKNN
jgi:DNA invertase Pin-like site-specific DNA recombinase